MHRLLVSAFVAAASASAGVPNVFVPGQPARAEDMNKNFTYLDSAVINKATQATVGTLQLAVTGLQAAKADQSALEDAIKVIAAKVGAADLDKALKGKVDTATLRILNDLVAKKVDSVQLRVVKDSLARKADTSSVRGLNEALAKKADVTWVNSQISASAPIGMLASGKNLSDLTDKALARTNLGLGALAEKASLGAEDVGALTPAEAAATYLKAEAGYVVSYKDYTDGANPKRAKFAIGDAQYGLSAAGGALELYSGAGMVELYRTTDGDAGVRVGRLATEEWANERLAYLASAKPTGEWNFSVGGEAGYTDPEPTVGRDAKFGGTGIATNGLHVNGDATVSGTITGTVVAMGIRASNVADYVFEPDYKLAPLSEVEAFTRTHKHLPEVPSAKEIEKNGLDLAQMNLLLLKKVEELTLHTIALEKRMKAMETAGEP